MNLPDAEIVSGGSNVPVHVHAFSPCEAGQLTSPQLRKLVFCTGIVGICKCGVAQISKGGNGHVLYSRNGSRMS